MSLDAIIEAWMLNFMEEVHTMLPGRIEAVTGDQRVRVLPMVRPWLQNGNVVDLKPIADVLLVLPQGANGGLYVPPKAGDGVVLWFSELGIGNYMHGATGKVADADDPSKFSLSDCVATPGLFPFARLPKIGLRKDRVGLGAIEGASLELKDRVQLQNKVSSLRKELEAVWDVVDDLYTKLATWAPFYDPLVPTTPNPAQVALVTAAQASAAARKAAVQNFAE